MSMSIGGGKLALAMLVSISEGLCLEGELGAILFRALADMSAAGDVSFGWSKESSNFAVARCKLEIKRGGWSFLAY
jgi:hypothetical protein